MTQHTHQTAPTPFVEAKGIRFAYRRFGRTGGVPLVFNQHFTGTIDHWDPLVTDGLAATREVILFNNAGISNSSGEVPTTFEEMGVSTSTRSASSATTRTSCPSKVLQRIPFWNPRSNQDLRS
jgi:pimeloyl-ACP methyl ester carboxylesterase